MNIECSTAALQHAVKACADLQRTSPEAWRVSLTAIPASPEHPARLDICAGSAQATNGVIASLPASVEEAGQVCLQASTFAETLATLRGEWLHLSQVAISSSPPSDKEVFRPFLKGGPALQLEGSAISRRGTVSTQRIRLRLSSPEVTPLALPDLAAWRASGQQLGEVTPAAFRAALAPCLSLARQRQAPTETALWMNHALVLLRCDTPLQWTATTRGTVASTRMFTSACDRALLTHALFDERELHWVHRALAQIHQPVRLTLIPQEEGRAVVLLVESEEVTLFCLGTTEAIPLVWEKRSQQKATVAVTVERVALQRAVDFFSATSTGRPAPHVQVSVHDSMLSVQGPLNLAGDAAEQQIPVLDGTSDIPPMMLHLRQMRRLLRLLAGPTICLEMGTLPRLETPVRLQEQIVVDWLRFSPAFDQPSLRLMMAASQPKAPASPPVQEQNGAVLETI